jgi:hypothetical protein
MERNGRRRESGPSEPPHLWTLEAANARLPALEELLPRLRGWVARLGEVHAEVERMREFWGAEVESADHVDHEIKRRLDTEWTNLTKRLEDALASLRSEGIEVKNLETGLVDFYGLEDGEVVYLCWQHGEEEIGFYHTLTGGFANRRPLPGRGPATAARSRSAG